MVKYIYDENMMKLARLNINLQVAFEDVQCSEWDCSRSFEDDQRTQWERQASQLTAIQEQQC